MFFRKTDCCTVETLIVQLTITLLDKCVNHHSLQAGGGGFCPLGQKKNWQINEVLCFLSVAAMAIPSTSPWLVNELGEPLCTVVAPPPYSYDPNGSDLPRGQRSFSCNLLDLLH